MFESLVQTSAHIIGNNKPLAAFLMIVIGLLVSEWGLEIIFFNHPYFNNNFCTPLCIQLGFSRNGHHCNYRTSRSARRRRTSPASDSTLGPTFGLNADGQHHHIWDSCVNNFFTLQYNRYLYSGYCRNYIIKGGVLYAPFYVFIFPL